METWHGARAFDTFAGQKSWRRFVGGFRTVQWLLAAGTATFLAAFASGEAWTAKIGVAGGYDSNVYRVDVGELGRSGSLTLALHPSLDWSVNERLALTYVGQATFFLDASSEDNARHTVTLRFREDDRFHLQHATTRVHGPRDAVTYPEGRNAWSTTLVRERRDQWQHRTRLEAVFRHGEFFVRPAGSLTAFDLDSRVRVGLTGYDNWINRYDLRGGFDLGRTVETGEAYLGWRAGRQHQGRQGGRTSDRSNDYNRIYLGYSGKPTQALTLNFEAGPSFHRYDDPGSVGPTAIDSWYLESRARWQINPRDTLTGTAAISKAVASTGLLSSELRTFSGEFVRDLGEGRRLRLTGGARALTYDGRPISDWLFTARLGWIQPLADNLRLSLDLEREEGRDRAPPRNEAREFTRTLGTLRLDYSF